MQKAEIIPLTVGENAYQQIRSDIIFGRIAPGQKLRLDHMKSEYGVGISTLRELLSRLAAEGLVLAEGQRGFEVPPVTPQDLGELAELRLVLESHAIISSFVAGDMEWEGRVVSAGHKLSVMEQRILAGESTDSRVWKRYDLEFHQALISACGSRQLIAAHATAFDKYVRYQMVAFSFRGEMAASEHRKLRDHAIARDSQAAIAILSDHINGCVEFTLATGAIR